MNPRAVLFDAYGTLFDVYSVAALGEQLYPGHGERLAVLWRDKQIEYTRLVSMSGRHGGAANAPDAAAGSPFYRPFGELTRAALRHAVERLQLPPTQALQEQLMAAYRHLAPHPEAGSVLAELRRRGVRAGILSNGDPAMLAELVDSAGLTALLDPVISVHPTRRYKTDPATYALGPAALALPADQILFVSSNGWDAIGATWYGYTTLWVNRAGGPLEALDTLPHHTGRSLHDVLALFPPQP